MKKKVFFSYLISGIPKCPYMGFFRKCSMFHRNIPLRDILKSKELKIKTMFMYFCLRFYATFKLKKFEPLLFKINTCLQKSTTCIALLSEQIFSVNI